MARKKNKGLYGERLAGAWDDYFGGGELSDWQRLCHDLGIDGDLSSRTKCRKAMRGTWINIRDFLEAPDKRAVHHFASEHELSQYTLDNRRSFPMSKVKAAPKGSPLKLLLANILNPGCWGRR